MSHKDALDLLTPLALGDTFIRDITIEGAHLDRVADRGSNLHYEQFPSGAYELLAAWERTYATAPIYDDSLQVRQARVIQKMRELGRLDRNYFIQLAAAYGYTVWIDELHPFMTGWGFTGDELGDEGCDWCWRVWVIKSAGDYFRVGQSLVGEFLSCSNDQLLETILNDLKPADTYAEIIYL